VAVQVSHCGGAVVGWGPTSVTAYLPWPRGVTPSLDTISFMACGLVSVYFSKLISWLPCPRWLVLGR